MSSLLDVIILKNAGGRACGSKNYAFLSQGYTHDEFQQQNSGGKLPRTLAVTTIGNYDALEYSNPLSDSRESERGFECPEFSHILILGASRGARGGVEFLYGRHWKGVGMEAHKLRWICSVCDASFLLE